jgi:hypothetical protein
MDDIVDLVSRSDDELRALVAELEAEERDISRRRRILQGKLDILRAELVMRLQRAHSEGEAVIDPTDVESLSRILSGQSPEPKAKGNEKTPPAEGESGGDEGGHGA